MKKWLVLSLFALASCAADESSRGTPSRGGGGGSDTGGSDTGVADTGTGEDTGASSDTGVADTDMSDTDMTDTETADTEVADTTPVEDTTPAEDTTPPRFITGSVTVFESRSAVTADLNLGSVTAAFREGRAPEETPVATFGDCKVYATAAGASLPAATPSLDAGTIAVAVGATNYTLTLGPSADGNIYTSSAPSSQNEFFSGGETISYSAPGGADVPAFSGTVTAPAEPTITAPAWSAPFGGSPRSSDLQVSWSGRGGTSVVVALLNVNLNPAGPAGGNAVTCVFPDTGSGTIPSGALQQMASTSFFGGTLTAMTVIRIVENKLDVNGSEISLNASATQTIVGPLQ